MKREDLIREKVRLEIERESIESNLLINEKIQVPQFGQGTLVSLSPECVTVCFDGKEKRFETDGVETPLFIEPDAIYNIIERSEEINSQLVEITDIKVENLIKTLLEKWVIRPGMEDDYRKVAEDLTENPESGMDNERPILDELRMLLTTEDWNRLPDYIFDV